LEGIVAKRKTGTYSTISGWLKIKNPNYTQSERRHEVFESFKTKPRRPSLCQRKLMISRHPALVGPAYEELDSHSPVQFVGDGGSAFFFTGIIAIKSTRLIRLFFLTFRRFGWICGHVRHSLLAA
jgi:hypothetical protein